jgi:hypothetical protein
MGHRRLSDDHHTHWERARAKGKTFFSGDECIRRHQRRWYYASDGRCESCEWEKKHPGEQEPLPLGTRKPPRSERHKAALLAAKEAHQKWFFGDNCQMHRRHDWNQRHWVEDDRCCECTRYLSSNYPYVFDAAEHIIHARSTIPEKKKAWRCIQSDFVDPNAPKQETPKRRKMIKLRRKRLKRAPEPEPQASFFGNSAGKLLSSPPR